MSDEIKINISNGSISFINNGIGFSQFGVAREILDLITNLQENYEKEHYLVDKLTRQLNDEYKNTEYQCRQKEDYKTRCEKAINICNYLLNNEKIIINDKEYIKQPADDYITQYIKEALNGGDE